MPCTPSNTAEAASPPGTVHVEKTGREETAAWFLDPGPVKATALNVYRTLNRNLS